VKPAATVALLAACIAWPGASTAQSYPLRPIRVIAPFPAGSGVDVVARLIATPLAQSVGQPVVVDNRPGAAGKIACELAARAAPDGYTLLLGNASTLAMLPNLDKRVEYDPVKSFAPIALISSSANVLVVHPSVAATSVSALIALAKAKPGSLNYGSAGSGNSTHLAAELFKLNAGVDLVHVPYKGTPPMITDLLSGRIQLSFTSLLSALPHVQQGRLRALGVTSLKRAASLPDVPTISEAGLKGYEMVVWQGILAPARTPQPIVAQLNREVAKILQARETRERLAAQGLEPAGGTPQEFGAYIAAEVAKWAKVIRHAAITLE
jgi:tripartite-type tricarboxylate transporter receptor subunit TctC